ncbi:hypothetical protein J051_2850 [Klebsiella pneumoniae 440_1540]|nr:hypothetical protein CSB98_1253 [Klebsiella pneumoniae]EOR15243.1 hypothetical protein H208_2986 [Klebsiella pneumoniae UHKPC23]EOY68963.1 hypothetical protein H207_2509 [Klebsiella pneumoniae UHKPC40]EOY78791.1 hypothetical protein H232_0735 [Klebsiella pneumoniae UHKPC81]EOY79081.1 hypothetical protein H230_3096 [Klebsiella pneumoniae UHKPC09]EOY80674.1 hypothetical protein H231_2822 [Klebsiella pneumoniae UHKPC01]EOY90772.1 hypothetical protein H233_3076 [Klebsiella pneumoniae UHKPC27]
MFSAQRIPFFFARLKSLQDINFVNTFRFADCNGGRFQA